MKQFAIIYFVAVGSIFSLRSINAFIGNSLRCQNVKCSQETKICQSVSDELCDVDNQTLSRRKALTNMMFGGSALMLNFGVSGSIANALDMDAFINSQVSRHHV